MTADSKDAAQAALPLFYEKPEALHAGAHADLRLTAKADFRFAAKTNAVPVMASEFMAAGRFYPIVFAGDKPMPVAILGLEEKNLFVTGEGGWLAGRDYIPAYVRRYPFTFIQQADTFILGVDLACERLVRDGKEHDAAQPLFADGKPSKLTQDALTFCGALQADHVATQAFAAALAEQDLLVEQAANAVSGQGRRYGLTGFRSVDLARFQALPDAVVVDWHRKGWLALVGFHLASQQAWRDLIDQAGAQEDTQ